ncbi:MAG TPA: hypothetical protein VGV13_11295 [Methylomirabilota bacterium]|jgi:hypothetical protein|nr:hypothetical protein [Methylomirabilota bacterium]
MAAEARRRYVKIGILLVLLSPVIVLAVSFVVMFVRASNQAEVFCAQVVVGGPIEGLEAKAQQLGLAVRSHPAEGAQPAVIVAVARGPYWPRCIVEHINGRVVGKRTSSSA